MVADLTTLQQRPATDVAHPRFHAVLSSLMLALSACLAAALFVTAILITFPLMLAAIATVRLRGSQARPGWHELELVEA
ncbi:MAG: hypothetical protein V2I43_18890 [Parvularcula sp.]|jgi:hypothetical protein|nr:hypothetical protein [Parvularcula sp.]